MCHRTRSGQGFTLVELLVTVAIAATVLMLGAPALGGLLARTRSASAEASVADTLRHARASAVARNLRVLVCPSSDGRQCERGADWRHGWIVAPDDDGDGSPDPGRPVMAIQAAMPEGTRVVTTAGRTKLTFQPTGSAGGSNVTFTVCHARDRSGRSVVVANSGRVRVQPADATHLAACLADS